MPTNTLVQDISANARMRWREPYVSEGLNEKLLPLGKGIFRGWGLQADATTNLAVDIVADVASADHLVVFETSNGFSLTIDVRPLAPPPAGLPQGSFLLSLSAFAGQTVVLAVVASYSISATTTSAIQAYDLATFNGLAPNTAVGIGTVVVPASGLIPAGNVSLSGRMPAWQNRPIESIPWDPIVRNGSFEQAPLGIIVEYGASVSGYPPGTQIVPFWEIEFPSTPAAGYGWEIHTNPAPGAGLKNMLFTAILNPLTAQGKLFQIQNLTVVPGQHLRMMAQVQLLQVLTGGSVAFFAEWGDVNGNILSETTAPFFTSSNIVDVNYRKVDLTMTVPANAETLRRCGFDLLNAGFTNAVDSFRIDDVHALLEIADVTQPYRFDDRQGDLWSTGLTLIAPGQTAWDALGANLVVDPTTPVNEGSLIIQSKGKGGSSEVGPMLVQKGRLQVGAGALIVSTLARLPRIQAPYSTNFPLTNILEMSAQDGSKPPVRLHADENGFYITNNCFIVSNSLGPSPQFLTFQKDKADDASLVVIDGNAMSVWRMVSGTNDPPATFQFTGSGSGQIGFGPGVVSVLSNFFASDTLAASTTPRIKGKLYQDMECLAWGTVLANGSLVVGRNIASTTNPSTGSYVITLAAAASGANYSPIVGATELLKVVRGFTVTSTVFDVSVQDMAGAPVNGGFSFVVFGIMP